MRVLLVDGDIRTACIIRRSTINNLIVDQVKTGEEVLLATRKSNYAMLVMDLILPDVEGFEIIRQLRRRSDKIIIFVLSSMRRPEAKAKAISLGANHFLARPFSEYVLAQHIEAIANNTIYRREP